MRSYRRSTRYFLMFVSCSTNKLIGIHTYIHMYTYEQSVNDCRGAMRESARAS